MGSLLQAKSIVTVLFVMAATAALVTCAGIQPLPDGDNNTFPTATPESAVLTLTNTCLNGGRLLLAFGLNGEARFSSSELSSPGQKPGTPAPKIKLSPDSPYCVANAERMAEFDQLGYKLDSGTWFCIAVTAKGDGPSGFSL